MNNFWLILNFYNHLSIHQVASKEAVVPVGQFYLKVGNCHFEPLYTFCIIIPITIHKLTFIIYKNRSLLFTLYNTTLFCTRF